MSKNSPVSFKDLNTVDLLAAAEHFGVVVEDGVPDPVIVADLVENGVDWELYHKTFIAPTLEVEEVVIEDEPVRGAENVITTKDLPVKEETVTVIEEVVTAPEVPVFAQANYLIKMERKNPHFEFGKYKFTKDNPYAIMPAEDAQRILSGEDGFRQAYPDELREYYS